MPAVQHNRIRSRLLDLVAPEIDVSDISAKPGLEFDKHKLSRCIAAAAIRLASDADAPTAAACVVDGGEDNGLDAIQFDAQSKTLYLVQAKWSDNHNGSIDLAGVLKFIEGVKDPD